MAGDEFIRRYRITKLSAWLGLVFMSVWTYVVLEEIGLFPWKKVFFWREDVRWDDPCWWGLLLAMFGGSSYFIWLSLLTIQISEKGIVYRGVYRRRWIPWNQVVRVRPGRFAWLTPRVSVEGQDVTIPVSAYFNKFEELVYSIEMMVHEHAPHAQITSARRT